MPHLPFFMPYLSKVSVKYFISSTVKRAGRSSWNKEKKTPFECKEKTDFT